MPFYTYLLYPFALIYGAVVSLRNRLFDWGVFREQRFDVPIICVGNLAVGGTGKTPHTELLISILKDKYKVAVLSRGYKRKTKGFILANETATAETIGDEPFQIKRKFPNIAVAVDSNRRRGIACLQKTVKPDVILLDDAFQHRYVKAGLSVLLTDCNCLYTRDCLLPAGRLREPKSGAERADMIIVTKCTNGIAGQARNDKTDKIEKELKPNEKQELYFSAFRYKDIEPVFPLARICNPCDIRHELQTRASVSVLLLTGIVNPQPLHDYLAQKAKNIVSVNFPDHHDFSQRDIENISKKFAEIESEKIIITTEKDAARLIDNPYLSEELKPFIYSIGIEVAINKEEEFNAKILEYVAKNKRNSRFSEK
ncbi:MAG: tetraacyldisaccharide 4'-kinase [Prevotellaceae bacterium]|jgi:tetraacyldisaccharide 4'-kinase|nr:tetraacyldisaccharide 4'-kinase [Prevotellaceae bacterium]